MNVGDGLDPSLLAVSGTRVGKRPYQEDVCWAAAVDAEGRVFSGIVCDGHGGSAIATLISALALKYVIEFTGAHVDKYQDNPNLGSGSPLRPTTAFRGCGPLASGDTPTSLGASRSSNVALCSPVLLAKQPMSSLRAGSPAKLTASSSIVGGPSVAEAFASTISSVCARWGQRCMSICHKAQTIGGTTMALVVADSIQFLLCERGRLRYFIVWHQ